jgi:hypothetical protein
MAAVKNLVGAGRKADVIIRNLTPVQRVFVNRDALADCFRQADAMAAIRALACKVCVPMPGFPEFLRDATYTWNLVVGLVGEFRFA